MAGQISRGARPKGRPHCLGLFFRWATRWPVTTGWLLFFLLTAPFFGISISWHCSLLVVMSILTRAPSAAILTPGTPAPSATLMWAETLFNALLASSGCISFAPPLPVQTLHNLCNWHCSGLALPACHPQRETGSPTQTSLHITPPASPPLPGFPPLPPGFYQSRPPGPPRYPCSIFSLEVGKESLKCSTCSNWVHFSCSSLTRADFCKICAAGSPMGWNCLACLNGELASPTHQQASPHPVSAAPPTRLSHPPANVPPPCLSSSTPTPSTNLLRSHGFISTSPLTPSPP